MEGKKFKVAYKRASNNAWNASEKVQRKKVIQYLERMIEELKPVDEDEDQPTPSVNATIFVVSTFAQKTNCSKWRRNIIFRAHPK